MSTVGHTPIYRIMRGGVDITDNFNDRTVQVSVELSSGQGEGADIFQLTVDDRDWRIERPQVGETLQIYLGYKEVGVSYMGLFEVSELTFLGPPKAIMLTGYSAGMSSVMKSQAIKEFDNQTVADMLGHFAGQAGLSLSISPKLADKRLPFKNVTGISGWHLMHELERHFGAVAKIENGKLIFIPRDGSESASGELLPTLLLRPEHLAEWQVRHTPTRASFSDVKAAWWDKDKHETVWESSPTGIDTDGSVPFRINRRFNSQDEAKQAIEAKKAALRRSMGEGRFTLSKGDPWIKAQMPVIVTNMRDGINGSYVIDSVKHAYIKNTGITTAILVKPPGDGEDYVLSDQLGDNETFSPIGNDPDPKNLPPQDRSRTP